MKKLVLALVALAFAFAFSSCCDQSYCPNNMRCGEKEEMEPNRTNEERPYRWDQNDPQSARSRRW